MKRFWCLFLIAILLLACGTEPDAPIVNEFPIAMECEFVEYQNDDTGLGVIGKVLKTSVEEAVMKDGKVDIDALEAIAFDPYTLGYYKVGGRVGDAFKDGSKLK